MTAASRLRCTGCGGEPGGCEPYPFRCPNADSGDGADHVLRRRLDPASVSFPLGDDEPNPFVRYRHLLHPCHVAVSHGFADAEFCELVRSLDRRVDDVDGTGFRVTPFARSDELSDRLGFSPEGGVWVKDETGNVSGSHKARHLFDVLLQLEVAERLSWASPLDRPELAIASCGNAALAAGVLAAAAGRSLTVFVPPDAEPAVTQRLRGLGARLVTCPREGSAGDPTYARLLEALAAGALPFTCQGNLNGLAVEGGTTLGYELVSSLVEAGTTVDRLVVQVGGGALASACYEAFADAVALGVLRRLPKLDTVQTAGAWPLKRAYQRIRARDGMHALAVAARHRTEYMWPWEDEPASVAHGILDDETYDWVAVCEGMLASRGTPVVVCEDTLLEANELARAATGIDVDHTGSSGLAGLVSLIASGRVSPDERVAVLFTGAVRAPLIPQDERTRDEKLSRQGHPVAQGVRA
jgi:threonine synthase